jgi:hypothetical protein
MITVFYANGTICGVSSNLVIDRHVITFVQSANAVE